METETGEITLTAKERQAYVEYQQIRFDYEGIERQYFYLIGQADWSQYSRLLEQLSQGQEENWKMLRNVEAIMTFAVIVNRIFSRFRE